MKQNKSTEIVRPTSLEQVNFRDGMIVTAEDLQDASNYPLDVFKTLIRAFFGCGIVCGLNVRLVEGDKNNKQTWCVEIQPGVALDCDGHPLELCKPVKIDLQEPYVCDPCPPDCVCIAIKRCTSEDAPRPKSGCGEDKSSKNFEPSRIREQVLIKVFDPEDECERPKNFCGLDPNKIGCSSHDGSTKNPEEVSLGLERTTYCDCMKTCSCQKCCGDCWVLLACIKLDKCGVECVQNGLREYIKPIRCSKCGRESDECVDQEDECDEKKTAETPDHLEPQASTSAPPAKKVTKKRSSKASVQNT